MTPGGRVRVHRPRAVRADLHWYRVQSAACGRNGKRTNKSARRQHHQDKEASGSSTRKMRSDYIAAAADRLLLTFGGSLVAVNGPCPARRT